MKMTKVFELCFKIRRNENNLKSLSSNFIRIIRNRPDDRCPARIRMRNVSWRILFWKTWIVFHSLEIIYTVWNRPGDRCPARIQMRIKRSNKIIFEINSHKQSLSFLFLSVPSGSVRTTVVRLELRCGTEVEEFCFENWIVFHSLEIILYRLKPSGRPLSGSNSDADKEVK